ncbi:MAG: SCO1664 family protein [Ornithinimicrobium sp.]
MSTSTDLDRVLNAPMHVEGMLTEASNLTLRVQFMDAGESTEHRGVYKPIDGEAPLADFPTGTLAHREVAAYLISELGGWGLVPHTVLRDGPMGMGSVQVWKDVTELEGRPASGLLDVVRPQEVPSGWLTVLEGEDRSGAPLRVVHRDDPDLAALAVLDAVLNNADRKAAHIALDASGHLWGFDHGLIGHVDPKLRTVLWGWAGTPLPERELTRVRRLQRALSDPQRTDETLGLLLTRSEMAALRMRVDTLVQTADFPDMPYGRYPLPWPLW